MFKNIIATIQARMGSTRLPGKVLKEVLGKPMLLYQIERIKKSILIDDIIIATTVSENDYPIVEFAEKYGIKYYRGSETDVFGRIVQTLKKYRVDVHVEFMGDNPIPDPLLVDSVIGFYIKHYPEYDYVSNAIKTTFPPGFEVFVYKSDVLFKSEQYIVDPNLREHVGLHIYKKPDVFKIYNIEADSSIKKYSDYHFEVDTEEDFEVIEAVIKNYYPENPSFSIMQAVEFMNKNPQLSAKNKNIHRHWEKYRDE